MESAILRFWTKVDKIHGPRRVGMPTRCWPWKPNLSGVGRHTKEKSKHYPVFWDGVRLINASRFLLQRRVGRTLKRSEFACHKCDNPKCLRPSHIFLGSPAANSADMVSKNRKEIGVDVFGAKLTETKVLEMRLSWAKRKTTLRRVARAYGVDTFAALCALKGKTWKHVGGPLDNRGKWERNIKPSKYAKPNPPYGVPTTTRLGRPPAGKPKRKPGPCPCDTGALILTRGICSRCFSHAMVIRHKLKKIPTHGVITK